MVIDRWENQNEAMQFAIKNKSCMLDMEMGTGKTRVAIDTAFSLDNVHRILIVCPKAVVGVWRENLIKFADSLLWTCWDNQRGTVKQKTEDLKEYLKLDMLKQFVVINYDAVWRKPMGDLILRTNFDMVVLDESHRAKAAGSKVSKFLAVLGRRVDRKMCLSGTPMANSPLDIYGQYRFLDPSIFGTNYYLFKQQYAVMGGPDLKFVVGYKNQKTLNDKYRKIAYTCRMSDIKDRIKLPDALPPTRRLIPLPSANLKLIKEFNKEFIAECNSGHIVANNVLTKLLRIQQITSGFCMVNVDTAGNTEIQELNTAKEDYLADMLSDISPLASVVVFCIFRHDIKAIKRSAEKAKRKAFELSGNANELSEWKNSDGAVIAVQIQAGAEGIDMTKANHAIYFSVPHSLALYNQSKARLYRPGQTRPVSFIHLIAQGTVDEAMYKSLMKKKDVIESIKNGEFDFGYTH